MAAGTAVVTRLRSFAFDADVAMANTHDDQHECCRPCLLMISASIQPAVSGLICKPLGKPKCWAAGQILDAMDSFAVCRRLRVVTFFNLALQCSMQDGASHRQIAGI